MIARNPIPRMAIALLSLLGLLDSAYLTLERFVPDISLVCLTGGGCETVQRSSWSTLPPGGGVPVAVLGIAGYSALLVMALLALQSDHVLMLLLPVGLLVLASGGVLFSLYLTYLQFAVIGAVCSWCLLSAMLELGIFVATLIDWRAWRRLSLRVTSGAIAVSSRAHS